MLARYQTNRLRALRKSFESWRLKSDAQKVIERLHAAIQVELTQKNSQNQALVQALQAKQEDLQRELAK